MEISSFKHVEETQISYSSPNNSVTLAPSLENTQGLTQPNEQPVSTSSAVNRQKQVEQAMNSFKKISQQSSTSVHVEYNKEAEEVVLKLVDDKSNQVLKQIPSSSVLDMDVQIRKFLGLLFDKFV